MDFEKRCHMREMQEDEEITITISNEKTMEAKRKETGNWNANGVFGKVEWEGQDTTRWVITEKKNKEGKTVKAGLLTRGFGEELKEYATTESPTCSKNSLRLALTIMLIKK